MTQTTKPLDVGGFTPEEGKGKAFVAKHTVATIDDEDPKGDTETQHKADNVKTFDRAKNHYGYTPGEDAQQYESLYDLMADDILTEILKPSMGASKYIEDFVHSDDPRFEGKSKKERIKMALGAFYSAKNEEIECLDETIYLDAKRMDDGAFSTKYGFSKQHFISKIEMPSRKMRDHIRNGKVIHSHYYEHVEIFANLPRKGK